MKKITFLLVLLTVTFGYSQTLIEDFDGVAPTITPNNGLGSAAITTDPAMGGTNGNVLQIVSAAAGDPWQQADILVQTMDLTSSTTISVDVYATSAINVLAKVDVGATASATDANHGGAGWETLEFDFSDPKDGTAAANGSYGQISFFPSWAGDGAGDSPDNADWFLAVDGTTLYFDNITVLPPAGPTCDDGIQNGDETGIDCGGTSCAACPAQVLLEDFDVTAPSVTPTGGIGSVAITTDPTARAGGNVLQIVSAAAGDPWQQADLMMQNVAIDLSVVKTVSVDVYSTSAINVLAKVIDAGATDSATDSNHGGTGWETLVFDFTDPKDGTGAADGQYGQISFYPSWAGDGAGDSPDNADWFLPVDGTTLYFDDVTAVAGMSLSTDDFSITDFTAYPNPTTDKWNIKTNGQDITSVRIFDMLGKSVISLRPNRNAIEVDASTLPAGLYFARLSSENGSKSIKLVKQ